MGQTEDLANSIITAPCNTRANNNQVQV